MRPAVIAFALLAGLFLMQRARASTTQSAADPYPTPQVMNMDDAAALSDPFVVAFLRMLRVLEHSEAAEADGSAYNTFFGGTYFADLSDHPVLTGEKVGVPLPPAMCVAAGYPDGKCGSTAAGAYQFIVPTWREVRGMGVPLTDFSPSAQDQGAVRLLRFIGALEPLRQGNLNAALRIASKRWASLPYSTAQQHPKPLAVAVQVFHDGLV